MTPETVITVGRQAMEVITMLAGPLLGAALLIGLVVGVFQAATQINEMTLSFVPKLVVMALVLLFVGPWMLSLLMSFTQRLYAAIPGMIG